MKKLGWVWTLHKVKPKESYIFVLEDDDTRLTGKNPGNAGKVKVILSKGD